VDDAWANVLVDDERRLTKRMECGFTTRGTLYRVGPAGENPATFWPTHCPTRIPKWMTTRLDSGKLEQKAGWIFGALGLMGALLGVVSVSVG